VVTTFVDGASAELLSALPNLEIIASYGVGIDRIALDVVKQRGLLLTNTPDISEPVADAALALLLAVTRRICQADRFVRDGQWSHKSFPFGTHLGGKLCGIVGLGRIGKAIAVRAQAFGMRIAYYGPNRKPEMPYEYYDNLVSLARDADFLVLALPGGAATRHIVNADVLNALGLHGFLVNVARGSVVDEAALIRTLEAGGIAGAALDVYEHEPLGESPLMQLENVVLLPHIASATVETRHEMGNVVMANLKAHFSGGAVHTPISL
jgi:lactate dehydrogenase-like 2-hydroxyacid dehydrogenase